MTEVTAAEWRAAIDAEFSPRRRRRNLRDMVITELRAAGHTYDEISRAVSRITPLSPQAVAQVCRKPDDM